MRRVLPLLVLMSLAFAPAPFPRSERRTAPVNDMIGVWGSLVITHDRMTYGPQGGPYDWALKVNPRASPRTFDVTGIGQGNWGAEYRGIYKIEGDVLTLTYNVAAGPRPTSFEPGGSGQSTDTYRRSR